jgi:O-antigen/teichoic acid export membrane protein
VGLIGGGKYVATEAANLYRILIVCSLLFPLERFLGVTLDIIGRPQLNLVKVVLALVVNVVADVACIYFTRNIYGVAAASIITLLASTAYGYFILRRYLPISFSGIPELAAEELRGQFDGLMRRLRPAKT